MARTIPRVLHPLLWLAGHAGFDVYRAAALRHLPRYWREAREYGLRHTGGPFALNSGARAPILTDYRAEAGVARGHYFNQDLWASRRVFARRPRAHVDVGSRIDGFVAHVLTFMPVTEIDVRPLASSVAGLTFIQADARRLAPLPDASVESLSSLHAVEHIGLGRYGDPIDPDGWLATTREFVRVLQPGGHLYFSVPVGRERLEFNSHRVFAPQTILRAFAALELVTFAAVLEDEALHDPADPAQVRGADFACGLFEFVKP